MRARMSGSVRGAVEQSPRLLDNMAKADRPKSAMAMLPPRPLRGSGTAAQTAFRPARSDGKSFIPTVNHFFNDLGIPKIRYF